MYNKSGSRFIMPILSGILLGIPFQFPELYFVNWIGLIPLLLVIKNQSVKGVFKSGVISGGVFFGFILYWLAYPQMIFDLPIILAIGTVVLLCSLLAFFIGIFSVAANYILTNHRIWSFLLIPTAWTTLEYLRVLVTFKNLPFGIIGYSQAYLPLLIQIADLVGVYGVTFLVILLNILIYKVILYLALENILTKKEVIISCLILIITVGYGIVKLDINSPLNQKEKTLRLGMMQPNIRQKIKWNRNHQSKIIDKYIDLTEELLTNKEIDLIIWPETAVPFILNDGRLQQKKLFQKIDSWNLPLLTGALNQTNGIIYNQALLINYNLDIIDKYSKVKLVPFGEYLPYKDYFPKFIRGMINDKTPGTKLNNFNYQGINWSNPICSEILNPDLVSKLAVNNHFLINISNEAWFKKSSGPIQTWQSTIFRAVENRKPVIKVSNTGISGVINAQGRVVKQITPFQAKTFTYNLRIKEPEKTVYSRFGNYFIYLITLISTGLLLMRYY
ncbi:apolipoprotein N-acyltransferase [Acetohalobium arabaticum]|uniref:Apolipoprotein N-acyltransferase n=1 Tax=Acetohalobium arabaticum (strain ATCC 49924 / DSM 5501 / Z-7288) TaxID=574087 RepID=D9QQA5_ACEAZ|nr:apolipoprotein N-acyltransferase [Acetohalobium arabaticum]ADL12696.1 apolipoprotein N-acyltransferase [Acetohalobium arabaticum DSM 5501]